MHELEVCSCFDGNLPAVGTFSPTYYSLSAGQVQSIQRGHFIAALVSLGFAVPVLLSFLLWKHHRAHPSELLLGRVACDIVFALLQIISYARGAVEDCGGSSCTS
jgi:hypothetical protein